jgi:hypothetical protein
VNIKTEDRRDFLRVLRGRFLVTWAILLAACGPERTTPIAPVPGYGLHIANPRAGGNGKPWDRGDVRAASDFSAGSQPGTALQRGLLQGPIRVGAEYVLIDNPGRTAAYARELAPIGFTAIKHYAEHAEWGAMQSGPAAPIDFRRLDAYVRSFQAAGIAEIIICLRSASSWGSVQAGKLRSTNLVPKPQFTGLYERWIAAVVERYDGDGNSDMPGLRGPVRLYEIGSELSTYEPEPVEKYLGMLERAYRAAHAAFGDVLIAHAAFLTTTAFARHPAPGAYEAGFAAMPPRIAEHGLTELRKLLDRGDIFDVVNVHSLGDPTEIEDITAWLDWEMNRRGYRKPVIISDTAMTPWIAWGPAFACNRPPLQMGVVILPATEADRCRLAEYFRKLVDGDAATVRWTQGLAAADNVKRVVIAADRHVALINTAFIEDLVWLKLKVFGAGTGPSAWSGLIDLDRRERRASYWALQQLMRHLRGYDTLHRVSSGDADVRVYEISVGDSKCWIAWLELNRVLLPGEAMPSRPLTLTTGGAQAVIEPLITRAGLSRPEQRTEKTRSGRLSLSLTPEPVFIIPAA